MELPPYFAYDPTGTSRSLHETEHQRQVSKYCEAVYEEAKDDLEKHEEIMHIDRAISYLMGKQWVERRPSYKAAPVSNRIWSNLVQLVSYLTDVRQSFEVKATNKLYDGHAEVLNKVARAWFYNEDFDMTLAMAIIHSALTLGYVRQVWNPDLNYGQGEIEVTPLGAMDLVPIRPTHTLQRSMGVVYRAPKPLSWFREKYPLRGHAVPSDPQYSKYVSSVTGQSAIGLWGRAWQFLSPQYRRLFGNAQTSTRDSALPMALYREFWLRDPQRNTSDREVFVGNPTTEYGYAVRPGEKLYPRGRLIVFGGPMVLYDGPNPHWHGQFPFSCLRLNRVPWQWPGVSEFRNQIPLQDIMNNVLAGILDMTKKAVNPPLVAPDNAFGPAVKKSFDPNMPNAKIFYSPTAIAPPTYAQTPQLPGFVFQTMLYAQGELDSQSGFMDLQAAARRAQIPAADTLEQLKEGQQTMVRLKVRYIESFIKEIGQQFIPNVFQFYSLKRRIQLLGSEGMTWSDFDWDPGTMVPDQAVPEEFCKLFVFMVTPGSLLKSARIPQQIVMMNMRRGGDMDLQTLMESLDMGGLFEKVKARLEEEGRNVLLGALRNQKAGTAGGAGVAPEVLQRLTNATTERPEPIQ